MRCVPLMSTVGTTLERICEDARRNHGSRAWTGTGLPLTVPPIVVRPTEELRRRSRWNDADPDDDGAGNSRNDSGGEWSVDQDGVDTTFPPTDDDTFMPFVKQYILYNDLVMRPADPNADGCEEAAKLRDMGLPFELAHYQKVPAALAGPRGSIQRAVIRFDTGSGKTCIMSRIIAAYRHDTRPVIVIVPSEEQRINFFEQMSDECPGPYRDELRALNTNGFDESAVRRVMAQKGVFCLSYVVAANRTQNSRGQYMRGEPEPGRDYFDNTIVLMDEVHNLINNENLSNATWGPRVGRYLKPALKRATNSVILGFTATPITKNYEEIVDLLNVMKGRDVISRREFSERFLTSVDVPGMPGKTKRIITLDRDRIEELERMFRGVFFVYENKRDWDKVPTISAPAPVRVEMGTTQLQKLKQSKGKPGWLRLFWNIVPRTPGLAKKLRRDRDLEPIAPKLVRLMELVNQLRSEGKKCIIYSSQDATGAELVANLLLARGWSRATARNDRQRAVELGNGSASFAFFGKRFKEVSVQTRGRTDTTATTLHEQTSSELKKVREAFNAADNTYGEKMPVGILSKKYTEGINFKDVRAIILLEAPSGVEKDDTQPSGEVIAGDLGRYKQVVGRARRVCSHARLPKKDWNIDVYIMESVLPREERNAASTVADNADRIRHIDETIQAKKDSIRELREYRDDIPDSRSSENQVLRDEIKRIEKEVNALKKSKRRLTADAGRERGAHGGGRRQKSVPEGFMTDREAFLDAQRRDATSRSVNRFLRKVAVDCPANRTRTGATVCLFEALEDPHWVPSRAEEDAEDDPFDTGALQSRRDGESMYAPQNTVVGPGDGMVEESTSPVWGSELYSENSRVAQSRSGFDQFEEGKGGEESTPDTTESRSLGGGRIRIGMYDLL